MHTLASYILLALIGVLIGGVYFWKTYQTPRDLVLGVFAFLSLSYCFMYGASVFFSNDFLTLILVMLVWWFLCSILAQRSFDALKDFTVFSSVVILCGLMNRDYLQLGVSLMVISAVLSSIYGVVQHKFKYEPMKKSMNVTHHYAIGFGGNENMHGIWLVPHVFMSLWLAQSMSLWWLLAAGLLVYVIKLTRCKTAFLGLFLGSCYYVFSLFGLIPALSISVVGIIILFFAVTGTNNRHGWSTLRERSNYWRLALRQILKTPVFGLGFNGFQLNVPFLQHELNEKTKGEFLKPENYKDPYPQKCHNDYLQHVLDNGLVGLGLILVVVTYVLFKTPFHPLSAALVSLLGCGLFFHAFHIRITNVLFWFLVFSLVRIGNTETVILAVGPLLKIGILVVFATLLWKFVIKWAYFDYNFQHYFRSNGAYVPTNLIKLWPAGAAVHTRIGEYWFAKGNAPEMFKHSFYALAHHDGEQRLWELWHNLGVGCLISGSILLSKHCHMIALTLWPEYAASKKALKEIERIEKQMQGGAINAELVKKNDK